MKGISKQSMVGLLLLLIFFQLLFSIHRVVAFRGDGDKEEAKRRISRHPYIASIRNFGQYACTGILIGDKAVLTAAQCVDTRYDRSPFPEVWLNSSETFQPSEGTLFRKAVDVRMHPLYTGDTFDGYDIAVLLLNASTAPLRYVRFFNNWNLTEGQSLSILGYGRSSSSGSISPVLLIGEVRIVQSEQCVNSKDIVYLDNRTICVEGSVPCEGDQGGPVILNMNDPKADTLVGIISATSCGENQRMASIQNVTDGISAGWAIEQMIAWDALGTAKCDGDYFKEFGEALADVPQALHDEFWEDSFEDCY